MSAVLGYLSNLRVAGALALVLALIASAHAVLYKRDSRAAVGWVGVIWLVPVVGAVLYVMLGVNRIRRHASEVRSTELRLSGQFATFKRAATVLAEKLDEESHHLLALGRLVDRVTRRQLAVGNDVACYVNGDEAFPAMLRAIDEAERTVALSTYIFDRDETGNRFADALKRAVRRRVAVRVLIDGFGSRYSFPSIVRTLQRHGIRTARFMPTYVPWRAPFWNLRSHRKILVVDGHVGFTGGMNIRRSHRLEPAPKRPVQDLHFSMRGPVVRHLTEAFAEDWVFTTGEALPDAEWFPESAPAGRVVARGITDGPDEDFEKLRWTIHGAIASARRSVRIITPYFLPDATLTATLNVAALRGVKVEIVLPQVNNQPLVHWATRAMLWQVVKRGCDVYYSQPPFDHTKLLVVDGAWTLIGSANWDSRSLRLNFEFNVECYDRAFAETMEAVFAAKRDSGRLIRAAELDGRSLPVQLRDGVARLWSPYL